MKCFMCIHNITHALYKSSISWQKWPGKKFKKIAARKTNIHQISHNKQIIQRERNLKLRNILKWMIKSLHIFYIYKWTAKTDVQAAVWWASCKCMNVCGFNFDFFPFVERNDTSWSNSSDASAQFHFPE